MERWGASERFLRRDHAHGIMPACKGYAFQIFGAHCSAAPSHLMKGVTVHNVKAVHLHASIASMCQAAMHPTLAPMCQGANCDHHILSCLRMCIPHRFSVQSLVAPLLVALHMKLPSALLNA